MSTLGLLMQVFIVDFVAKQLEFVHNNYDSLMGLPYCQFQNF